jgi:mRNA interferase RelE/StbE
MEQWSLELSLDAEQDLGQLDKNIRRRMIKKLDWLTANFEFISPSVLSHELGGFYKLRVGDWRIIYIVNHAEKLLRVEYIDRRDKIYKR